MSWLQLCRYRKNFQPIAQCCLLSAAVARRPEGLIDPFRTPLAFHNLASGMRYLRLLSSQRTWCTGPTTSSRIFLVDAQSIASTGSSHVLLPNCLWLRIHSDRSRTLLQSSPEAGELRSDGAVPDINPQQVTGTAGPSTALAESLSLIDQGFDVLEVREELRMCSIWRIAEVACRWER